MDKQITPVSEDKLESVSGGANSSTVEEYDRTQCGIFILRSERESHYNTCAICSEYVSNLNKKHQKDKEY